AAIAGTNKNRTVIAKTRPTPASPIGGMSPDGARSRGIHRQRAMNELLKHVLEAHGGLARWNEFSTVHAQIVTGGGLWALKGLIQDAAPREMTVSLREEVASVTPFGQPNWRTNFRPERVAIETLDGEVVREQKNPRASLDGHTMNTPWDPLHRAYFNGYALWTYLTTPFFMALPGFEVREIDSITD